MSRSSDIDLDKYKAPPEVLRETCDQRAADERVRKALADPELRAMLAAEGRSVEFTPIPPAPAHRQGVQTLPAAANDATAEGSTAPAPAVRTSEPSPWAQEAHAAGVDASALPSAGAPAPEAGRRQARKAPGRGAARAAAVAGPGASTAMHKLLAAIAATPTRKALAAVAGAFLPAILVLALLKPKTIVQYVQVPVSASPATAAAGGPPPPTASVSAMPAPSGVPASSSSTPTTSAPALKPRPRPTSEDPYDAAPTPTVKPGPSNEPTAIPSAQPSAPPVPSQTAFGGTRVFGD
jgi:hypothetical protein